MKSVNHAHVENARQMMELMLHAMRQESDEEQIKTVDKAAEQMMEAFGLLQDIAEHG